MSAEAQLAALRQKAKERRAEAARAEAKLKKRNGGRRALAAPPGAKPARARGLATADEPALGAVEQSLKALDELRAR